MSWLNYLIPALSAIKGIGGEQGGQGGGGMSPVLGAVLGGVGGAATGGPSTQTTNQKTSQVTNSSNSGSSSIRRFLTPDQEGVMGDTGGYIRRMIANPNAATAFARTASINGINNQFLNAGQAIRGKFQTSGGNASGKAGRANREVDMTRRGAINDTNLAFDQKGLDLQQIMAQLGLNFSNINMGQDGTSSETGTSTTNGTNNGTTKTTQPGGMLGQGINGGVSTLGTLLTLQRMMNGGSSGGSGGDVGSGSAGYWGG